MSDLIHKQALACLKAAVEPLAAMACWDFPAPEDESDRAILKRIEALRELTRLAGNAVIQRRAAGRNIPALATLPELDGTAELLLATLSATEAALETEAERSLPVFKGEPS